MSNMTNLQLLTQTNFDSGALSGLGAVVHRLDQAGEHRISVFQADSSVIQADAVGHAERSYKAAHSFVLKVIESPQGAAGATPPSAAASAVHIDLSRVLGSPAAQPGEAVDIAVQGYVLFHAPQGAAGFAVQIHAPGKESRSPAFDSRQLHNGDKFTVTLLRPGRYSLSNGAATGEIRVSYPVIGAAPYRPPDPLDVEVIEQGFHPSAIQLKPTQGLIFHIGNVTARIVITLVEPDDGPSRSSGQRKPLYRWTKPGEAKPSN